CDFEPERRVRGKIPRQGTALTLRLKPTVDVIATVARRARNNQWMVAFALEPEADPRRALEKITTKRCDLIVVNDLTAIDATQTAVTVYDRSHARVGSRKGTKAAVATWLIRLIASRLM
ncbi:MAG: phosphopantothenoylcysteine decarboxylase, partial [Planctomycetia bacterium]